MALTEPAIKWKGKNYFLIKKMSGYFLVKEGKRTKKNHADHISKQRKGNQPDEHAAAT